MLNKLIPTMRKAGYAVFTITPDPKKEGCSVVTVYQDIMRMGLSPAFWFVLDALEIDGKWSMKMSQQTRIPLPEGTYLTF